MRRAIRLLLTALILFGGWAAPLPHTDAANPDTTAGRVFAQPDFTHHAAHNRLRQHNVPVLHGLPVLSALSPSKLAAGSPAFTLTANGSGFVGVSVVRWNGSDRPTTFLSSTQLNALISAADVAAGGPFAVTVFTPAPGGGTSSLVNLTLYVRAGQDTTADLVLGQPNFDDNAFNNGLLPGGANRLYYPYGVAVDVHTGRLFVADSANNRVLSWPNSAAEVNGQAADLVLGQPNFSSVGFNTGGESAKSLSVPVGVALDKQGNQYVADSGNSRVLEYDAPLVTHAAAARVFGQPGFTQYACGAASAVSLCGPNGVAVDTANNLYVADLGNNRVLEYDTPLTADTKADRVFGQPDLASNAINKGGVSAKSLDNPRGVALDAANNLYVSDTNNHRVLEYDAPLTTGMAAHMVFGQGGSFTTGGDNNGGVSANGLSYPSGVAVDAANNLYVGDSFNHRVLEYDTPLTAGTTADRFFGQPDFASGACDNGGVKANSLCDPQGVALDAHGNLYVGDFGNSRVLEFDRPLPLLAVFLPLIAR